MEDQGELEQRFNAAMLEIYERAGTELGYWATRYLQLLRRRGGLEAARYLLRQKATSDGYQALREVGRLDLTVESLVLTPEFAALFTSEELVPLTSGWTTSEVWPSGNSARSRPTRFSGPCWPKLPMHRDDTGSASSETRSSAMVPTQSCRLSAGSRRAGRWGLPSLVWRRSVGLEKTVQRLALSPG